MTEQTIYEYKSRPANAHQYETSEQIGKPFMYFIFSMIVAATGVVLVTANANRIYECSAFFWNETALAIGVGMIVGGLSSVVYLIVALFNREVAEIIEERQYSAEPEPPDRIATIHTSASDSIISLNQRGKKSCGVFFPNRVLGLVKDVGKWPTRNFWLQDVTWQGTGQDKWTTDNYNMNTSKLCAGGMLAKRGNRYALTELGNRFFNIDASPTR